ncbi:MAG: alpha/beta fold hydrolase [Alphaproteobacteria bacterium]|nr:alpha/beta fold hydrolase [Alphaproteobacteria bacterium]
MTQGGTWNGTRYEVVGAGAPVILVHGLGANRGMWQWMMPALAARFRVAIYDLFGHGDSDKPRDGYTMERFVGQVAGLADHLGFAHFGLIGFSLGGLIVQATTLAHPDRVAGLVILNAAHGRTEAERAAVLKRVEQAAKDGPAATVNAAIERWFTPEFVGRRPDVIAVVRASVLANDRAVYPLIYRLLALGDAPLAEAIRAIRCPTLVMTGSDDPGNNPAMAERMGRLIPGARVVIVPGLRHMGLAEDPDAFTGAIVPFLDQALGALSRHR